MWTHVCMCLKTPNSLFTTLLDIMYSLENCTLECRSMAFISKNLAFLVRQLCAWSSDLISDHKFSWQVQNLDAIVVPVSGGGMLSGICVAAKALKPDIKIYGAEPLNADDCAKSFAAKKRIPLPGVCLEPPVAAITYSN